MYYTILVVFHFLPNSVEKNCGLQLARCHGPGKNRRLVFVSVQFLRVSVVLSDGNGEDGLVGFGMVFGRNLRGMTGNAKIMMAQCTNSPMWDALMTVLIV